MKSVTLKPYTTDTEDKKLLVPAAAVRVNYRRTDSGWVVGSVRQITLVQVGRRVFFSDENDTDAILPENASIALGLKTATRLFQDALDGKGVAAKNSAPYWDGPLKLARDGGHIAFTAPCGARGRITVREAEKVVAHLKSLAR